MKAGHPVHTIPDEYSIGGFIMGKMMGPQETVELLQKGEGPHYDVLVSTYPRSGTAMIVEIAWLLMNDLNVEKAKAVSQVDRNLFLDLCSPDFKSVFGRPLHSDNFSLARSHLPYHMLEEHAKRETKIIVGYRNPKDSLVSLYHFYRMNRHLGNFAGTFDEFFELFKDKHLIYGDIIDHNLGWWNIRDRPNTMYVNYEDLAEEPAREVRRMAEFLSKEVSDEDVSKIVNWVSFGNMKDCKSTNYEECTHTDHNISPYMRKGTVGDWKNYLNDDQSKYIDEQYEENCGPAGLKYRFEL
ncbi:hypothetical protein CAPTEDRAFT_159887 [Capitella teleta]|uniref:Sulfotransferase domain-containing protein n=1 Tax=Capitella teleta TaxID=283909 RepID=R7T3B5_CAPTE|nr:hypothetical protein CAPTEDRAFT_159887 [Capitella teleta]|eukprot:ELT87177.1 hypothetical protein CAPTEDRAFT_159887 [Capitella teleta]